MPANESLSIISLITNASIVVKMVMLILFLGSVTSWVVIFQRARYLKRARQNFDAFEQVFWSGGDLTQLYRDGSQRYSEGHAEGVESIFRAGFKEFTRLRQQLPDDPDAVMEGTQRAMRIALNREEEHLEEHLPFLASVASVSPYIGLFGTVWGIMNSFRGLANVHQATLASVAPGISEALVATAIGLFAAIPAVLAYNRFNADATSMQGRYITFAEEFSSILHRQAHSRAESR